MNNSTENQKGRPRDRFGALGLTLAALGLGGWQASAVAGVFEFTPSVGIGAFYTDNVDLDPSGEEDSELIGTVDPGFITSYRSARLNAGATYRMSNFFYRDESDRDRTVHNLSASGVGELIEDALFLDATARAFQSIVDPAGANPTNDAVGSDNQTDTYTGTVSPYLNTRLGNFGRSELRYARGVVRYEDDLANSDINSISGRAESAPAADPVTWALDARSDRITYSDDTQNIKLRNVLGELGYRITGRTELLGIGGYENNNFEVLPQFDEPQGAIWAVGFRHSRAGRYELEALAGRRFFGNTYRLSWTQTAPRFSTSVNYADELVTTSIAQLERDLPEDPLSSLPGTNLYTFGDEVYLRKRGTASATLILPKTSLRFFGFWEKRESATETDNEKLRGGDLTFRWRLGVRTTFVARAGVQWNELNDFDGEDRLDLGRLALERQISRRIFGQIGAQYQSRDANDPDREYTERAVGLLVRTTF